MFELLKSGDSGRIHGGARMLVGLINHGEYLYIWPFLKVDNNFFSQIAGNDSSYKPNALSRGWPRPGL